MKILASIAILFTLSFSATKAANANFTSPVHITALLAGNFGEPRPNHFHGGIDIKTGGQEGVGIYSIGGGYISRISINPVGSGRCIYVRHPEGYTSLYLHLRGFSPRIRRYVERMLGRKLTNGQQPTAEEICDLKLEPGQMMVAQGEYIARSGNSGSSQGPHLHFEIRDTKTNDMLDPLDFLSKYIEDTKAPEATALMAYPQDGHGVFNNTQTKQSFTFVDRTITQPMTAWGKVGFGLWADDYTGTTLNHLGVRYRLLICDGDTVSFANLNNVPTLMNREVNAYGDFQHYTATNNWYLKSFREPGLSLPFITTSEKYPRGIVNINEARDYHFKYVLADVYGNKTEYTWTVKGSPSRILSPKTSPLLRLMRCDRQNWWTSKNAAICIPPRNLGNDFLLQPLRISDTTANALSETWNFSSQPIVMFRRATIYLHLIRKPAAGMQAVLVSNYTPDKTYPVTIEGDWAVASVRDLGAQYHIAEVPI